MSQQEPVNSMQTASTKRQPSSTPLIVIITAYLIFIVLGFPDGMLGVAWPSMMKDFNVQNAQMGTMLLASTIGFLLTSFNTGRMIRWFGISTLLVVSSLVRGVGLLGIALAPEWPILVGAAFLFGVGSGAIDGGMNTFFAMRVRSARL
ncbi:MAG: MFS transporter, partial [Caldilinea sp.]